MSVKAELFALSCDINYYLNHFESLPAHVQEGLLSSFHQRMSILVAKGISEEATKYYNRAMLSLRAFEANLAVSV